MSVNAYPNAAVLRLHPRLPIFRIDTPLRCILYTPGNLAVVAPDEADAIRDAWQSPASLGSQAIPKTVMDWLEQRAETAVARRAAAFETPFAPECLTIYLSNHCNLACTYCFASGGRILRSGAIQAGPQVIDCRLVEQAARLVAENCSRKQKPFQLVIHGGGEPTLHWEQLGQIVDVTRHLARQRNLAWFGYIATNGVLSKDRARWLARHFNAIGLSCDGPPDIQDRQRPLANGRGSSAAVERTAAILTGQGARVIVRATITPLSMQRQVDIVDYLSRVIRAQEIRFEPAYLQDLQSPTAFQPDDARTYVNYFLQAWRQACEYGCSLSFSGVRPGELHGPFCQTLRQVLQLTPDGSASACFLCTDARQPRNQRFVIGSPEPESGRLVLDLAKIQALRCQLERIPEHCSDCINLLHCSRGCPEVCPAEYQPNTAPGASDGFRCQVNRWLAVAWIMESAEEILAAYKKQAWAPAATRRASVQKLAACLAHAPQGIDGRAILAQFKALEAELDVEARQMPVPLWKRRGFEQSGALAWQQLQAEIRKNADGGPISIYVHIPFCEQRCGFCDCLAISLKRRKKELEEAYGRRLMTEMDAWAGILPLSRRPVTTVHFGGGSPNSLDPVLFRNIVTHCRQRFNTSGSTEWAIEAPVSLMSDKHLGVLAELGFARLHVGVQTLADDLRKTIGRRQGSKVVFQRLARAMAAGFITSVDMIYGLPGQTLNRLAADLAQLIGMGIHGISLYRLNRSSRNRPFLKRCDGQKSDTLYDYLLFQAADQQLTRHGMGKTHYTHYARPPDRNLYANHICRQEDLLALGATADGIFGNYLYRHGGYAAYVKAAAASFPALAGGLRETARERRIRPLTAALMSGQIGAVQFQAQGAGDLIDAWRGSGLVKPGQRNGELDLTANGSWFIYQMMQAIEKKITR